VDFRFQSGQQRFDWSDHWSFWQCGYPAIMMTDTALFRYPYYDHSGDTPDKLDRPAPRKPRPEGRGQGELYKNGNLLYREAPPGRAGRLHYASLARVTYGLYGALSRLTEAG
jgi:hypothetical protein